MSHNYHNVLEPQKSKKIETQRPWMNSNILWLSIASMLCDMGTEILKALLPALIISSGGSAALLAALESGGTVTLALTPLLIGWLSDYIHQQKLFVAGGYFFNGLGLGIIYSSLSTTGIGCGKLLTSLGKGMRHATKEALIGESVDAHDAGKAFGFNATLDTLGALIGPFVGFILLYIISVHTLFTYALFLPLTAALIVFVVVKEPHHYIYKKPAFTYSISHLPEKFKAFLKVFICFNMSNLLPSFFLLHAYHALNLSHDFVESASNLLLLYSLYNLMFVAVAYRAGSVADRLGAHKILTVGYALNTIILLCFAFVTPTLTTLALLFALMGIRAGLTEGVEKAEADNLLPDDLKGSGYGIIEFLINSAEIISTVLFGVLWSYTSTPITFSIFAAISGLSFIMLQMEHE